MKQPDLFDWTPPRRIFLFPMARRLGRVRNVATKMLDKPTDRAAASYRDQVTEGLLRQLNRLGIPPSEQDEQLTAFWQAVAAEELRLVYCCNTPTGAA